MSFFIGGLAFAGARRRDAGIQLRLSAWSSAHCVSAIAGAALLARAQAARLARDDEAD